MGIIKKLLRLFDVPAGLVYRRFLEGRKSVSGARLKEEVSALQMGRRDALREYQTEKIAWILLSLCVFLILTAAALIYTLVRDTGVPDGRLKRDGYGGSSAAVELSAQIEHESEDQIHTVTLGARQYSAQQARMMLEEAKTELEQVILGENVSPDHVDRDLIFPASLCGGGVSASYMTIPYGILSDMGELSGTPEREGSLVEIHATLSCQEETLIYETAVMVFPRILSREQQLREDIREALARADEEQAQSEYLELPGEVSGRRIAWRYPSSGEWRIMLAWLLLAPVLIWFGKDARIHAQAKARREQMEMDYPDILWRLTMLLGAGNGVRQAFAGIAAGYKKNRAHGVRRYAYEEMCYTLREMNTGVGEAAAYENFGRRCGLPGYIKLGSLLTMSVRKGTADLGDALEKEAALAMEERKNLALKAGERAGTKMLFPMILMLGVVIVILIIPAFMSMA